MLNLYSVFWCQPKWFGGTRWRIKPSGGHWPNSEINLHNNVLDLLAASYTLEIYCANMLNIAVLLKTDNTSALAQINKESASNGTEFKILKHICDFCAARNLQLWKWNKMVNSKSRNVRDNFKRAIRDQIFELATKKFGNPKIDLFPSRENYKLNTFFSYSRDHLASMVETFSFDWWKEILYAICQLNLIPQILLKK